MSSEDAASYSDALSDRSDVTASKSGSSGGESASLMPARKAHSHHIRSESIFLAMLFALMALLLPTLFSFAPAQSTAPSDDGGGGAEHTSPLHTLIPYIPTITSIFPILLGAIHITLYPIYTLLSLLLALLAPIFLSLRVLYHVLVRVPLNVVTGVTRALYPVYLLCGVACLLGAVVGFGARLVVRVCRWMLVREEDALRRPVGKRRARRSL